MHSNKIVLEIQENVYGSLKRLRWIIDHLNPNDLILEVGCGTGAMITLPLVKLHYHIHGLDIDAASISLGKDVFLREGLDASSLKNENLTEIANQVDVIIASEVLEHQTNEELFALLQTIRLKLRPNGRLLITVPNGRGWFEFESFFWNRLHFGKIIEFLRLPGIIRFLKRTLFSIKPEFDVPSSLSSSPHIQFFTYQTIQNHLEKSGFQVNHITGSTLFAGPFSNMLWGGINPVLKLNLRLGSLFPKIASGFYISCTVGQEINDRFRMHDTR